MPRASNGVYTLPPIYEATPGTTIQSAQHNVPLLDIAQALTNSLPRDGSAAMTGNLAMGGRRITGLGAPLASTDAVTRAYAQNADNLGSGTLSNNRLSGDYSFANLTLTGRAVLGAGTALLPGLAFAGVDGMGIRRAGDTMIFQTGESAGKLQITETVIAAIGGASFSGPGGPLTDLNANNIATGTVADARLPSTIVRTSRQITAGDGLTGGGDLSANRTFALGNHSADLLTSGTVPTARLGTAAPDAVWVGERTAAQAAAAIGTYAFLRVEAAGRPCTPGSVRPASQLNYSNSNSDTGGALPAGSTWRCCGEIGSNSAATLFLRVT